MIVSGSLLPDEHDTAAVMTVAAARMEKILFMMYKMCYGYLILWVILHGFVKIGTKSRISKDKKDELGRYDSDEN